MSDDIKIIDAHHHFWDLNQNYYPFLSDKIDENFFLGNYEFIRKNYLPIDYLNDSKEHNVIGTIHCEAEWDRNDQVGETRWLENLSKKNKFPNAIVAHAWFHKKNSEEVIAKQASFDMVKGIRSKPITKLTPNSDDLTGEGSMQDINWRNGLKLLEKYNLNYDLRIPNWHLEEAIEIVRLIPNTKVIINHAGFPWDRTEQGMEYWRKGIKLMSFEPNTFIKLSEFGVKDKDWNYPQNEQIIKELIDLFSPQRCMFASNFPVSKIKISFKDLYNNYKKIVKSFSSDEKKWLFAKTASEVYNL
jgi:predicted TIM-barrel fold metal-dependent hydrolase